MHTNMPFHPQKCFTPTLGENTKRVLVGIIALSSLKSLSQYFFGYKRRFEAMQNKSIEKREKRKKRKRTSVLERKKNKKDSPYHLVERPSML